MHLTLQQMRLFEAVARLGNYTQAARELHLTQPAVSIQLKRLEENAGRPLFEYVGKRLSLTPAGRHMQAACVDVLNRLRLLDDTLDALNETVRGPLELAVVTTAKYVIPHLLGAFLAEHPEVTPRLTVTNRARVLERLHENRDDFVIMGQVPSDMDLETLPFLDNPLVLVAPPGHPLAGAQSVPLARLTGERVLFRETGSGTRMAFERLLAEHDLSIEPYMELGSTEAIKQAVMAGLGLSVLPLHSVALERRTGLLAVLDVQGFPLERRWYAAHWRGKTLSRTARAFLDFLRDHAAEPAAALIAEAPG